MFNLLEEVTTLEAWLIVLVFGIGSGLSVVALNYKIEAEAARKQLAENKVQVEYAYEQLAHDMAINYMLCKEGISHEH